MIGRGAASGLVLVVLISLFAACATMDPWQDVRIESEVKARLVAEKSANLTRLGVVSRQAVVHLTGTVASPDQKALAEDLAKSVAGVRPRSDSRDGAVEIVEVQEGAQAASSAAPWVK